MSDPIEQMLRRGLAELVREKPALGPVDLDAIAAARSGHRDRTRSRPSLTRWVLAAAAMVLIGGIGLAGWFGLSRGDRVTIAEPQQRPGRLVGIRWLATQLGDRPVRPDATGHVPFLVFEPDGRVRGGDPCNGVGGTYRLDGDRLRLHLSGITEIGCGEPAITAQQSAYFTALTDTAAVRRDGPTLTLLDPGGAVVLVLRAADEPSPAPATSVLVRVRNEAAVDFDRVQAAFSNGTYLDYGGLAAGRTSEYRQADQVSGPPAVRVKTVDGRIVVHEQMVHALLIALPPGRYTYVLSIGERGSRATAEVRLEADQ